MPEGWKFVDQGHIQSVYITEREKMAPQLSRMPMEMITDCPYVVLTQIELNSVDTTWNTTCLVERIRHGKRHASWMFLLVRELISADKIELNR